MRNGKKMGKSEIAVAAAMGMAICMILTAPMVRAKPAGEKGLEDQIHAAEENPIVVARQLRAIVPEGVVEPWQQTAEQVEAEIAEEAAAAQAGEAPEERAYTDEELQILTNVVYYEANGCTDRHQQLVAAVVLNRVGSKHFPGTLREVVEQPRQYSRSYTRNLPALDTEDENLQKAMRNATAALEGDVECPENVVFQAEFRQGNGVYETIRSAWGSTTYFCYGPEG